MGETRYSPDGVWEKRREIYWWVPADRSDARIAKLEAENEALRAGMRAKQCVADTEKSARDKAERERDGAREKVWELARALLDVLPMVQDVSDPLSQARVAAIREMIDAARD